MEIVLTPVADAQPVLREYYTDIVGRYQGREATRTEVDGVLAEFPSDDLVLLLAKDDDGVLGCIGLDLSKPPFAEVKRVYVTPSARGKGVAQALLAAVEEVALERGAVTMRLDVRDDLVEARALYAKFGYTKTEPFNDDPYADHPMAKDLVHLAPVDPADARLTALIAELDSELWDRYSNEAIGPSPISPDVRFVLASRGSTPVGCVAVQPRGDDLELKRMYVKPEHRGTGVAPELVAAAVEVTAQLGGSRLILETGIRQPEAIRLYEKCGFTKIPNFAPYDRDPLSVCYALTVVA